ncbi:MAG: flagellar hook capping family protein [Micavibrio aeruginosavorus]|uniref:Basal-body rod modification protein FlgD n=1 Tax=Micavibrio aeruginosavorus TaxID=349221 RepID=A0A7T5R1M1_9BACT|nr:MAG: flagellar hook capping family protein [Micavibrio aeruginosavorus]
MTSDVTLSGTINKAQNTAQQSVKLAEDFTQFLTLLTTQLQNQDPLNPMDSTEFTNQLVQFSQVEQAINTNQKLDDLLSLQLASISSVALGYVGLDVTYTSAEMNWDGTQPVDINYGLSEQASVAKVNVYNEDGTLVRSMDAPKTVGAQKVVWDGKDNGGNLVEAGTYSVKVEAADKDSKPMTVTTAVSGNVRGIESQNGVIYLLVGERAIALSSVINASVPPETETSATES